MTTVGMAADTMRTRAVNSGVAVANAATLGPELILTMLGAGDRFPRLEANRVVLLEARANIDTLVGRAMEWDPEDPHYGPLRRYIMRDLALLTMQHGDFGIDRTDLDRVLLESALPRDLERFRDPMRAVLDEEIGSDEPSLEHLHNALTAELQLGATDQNVQTTVRCTDYPLANPNFLNVVTSAIGPSGMSKMTRPQEWPILFKGYWTNVVAVTLPAKNPNSTRVLQSVRESLDFTAGSDDLLRVPSLRRYQRVDVCLHTSYDEIDVAGRTKHVLEYELANEPTGYCRNTPDLIYNFDTGFVHVLAKPGEAAHLVQQKGIGFTYGVTTLIGILNRATCFAWSQAIQATTF